MTLGGVAVVVGPGYENERLQSILIKYFYVFKSSLIKYIRSPQT